MKIKFLKEICLRELKKNYEENDYSKDLFAEEFFIKRERNMYYNEIDLDIELPKLIISNNPKHDYENAKIIFDAMKNLPVIYAREESFWCYLTHFEYWDYMKKRWYKENTDICSRYFFKDKSSSNEISISSISYTRNGISRLWWGAYIVYNEDLDNPYEYLTELFSSQDLFVGICERSISKNKKLVTSILKMVRKHKLNTLKNNTKIMRECLKEINFVSAITMFEILNYDEIDEIIEKIVIDKINEFSNKKENNIINKLFNK